MKRLSRLFSPLFLLAMLVSTALLVSAPPARAAARPQARAQQANPPQRIVFPTRQEWQKQHGVAAVGQVQGQGDLVWKNGAIQQHPKAFLIFWGASWLSGSTLTPDAQIVKNYFTDVGGSAFENVLTQYYGSNGHIANESTLAGVWVDTSTPPADSTCGGPTIEDSDIEIEVSNAITTNGWPADHTDATYFVYTPNGYFVSASANPNFCSEKVFCAYHAFWLSPGLAYAAMPYPFNLAGCGALPSFPHGNASGDSLANVTSHEQFEAISDPQPSSGWIDAAGFEIGDKCAWDFSSGLTHLNNGSTFALQTEYSNTTHSCVNSFTPPTHIQTTPPAVNVVTTPGTTPGAQTVTLQNSGTGPATLNWAAGQLPTWVSVSPISGTLAAGASQTLTLTFTTISATPHTYAANLIITDTNANNSPFSLPIVVVATNVSKTWYFAEGYTGGSFNEWLTLANPNPAGTATVQVHYLLGTGANLNKTYTIGPKARFTVLVNNEVGNGQDVSMVVTSDLPIVAERPMYFTYGASNGLAIPGGSDVLGATSLATRFDFGYLDTSAAHDTWLSILNQNNAPLNVIINYFPQAGGNPIQRAHQVLTKSRGTIFVNQDNLPAGLYSALVTLDQPGLVERPLYLKDSTTGYTGSADVVGVAAPQSDWFFAEGYTSSQFSERYILSNPSASGTARATVTFLLGSGAPVSTNVTLAPGQLQIVDANALLSSGGINNSATVHADLPILAERFISFKYLGAIPGASDVLAAAAPSNVFYFAEGYTGGQFSEYLTIENPSQLTTAHLTVTFLPSNSAPATVRAYQVAPSSRFTLFTNSVMPGQSFAMIVQSSSAIVAERPMYFSYGSAHQTGGSDVIGYQGAPAPVLSNISVSYGDATITSYNATDGSARWYHGANNIVPSNPSTLPVISNGVVYFGSRDGHLYALRSSDGALLWNRSPIFLTSLSVVNGVLYGGEIFNHLQAFSASDGTLLWQFQTGAQIVSNPAVVNGVVYFGSEDNFVYALDAATGQQLWKYQTGFSVATSPTVANGLVYIGSSDGYVYALHTSDGTLAWRFLTGGSVKVDPLVFNGVVYIGFVDGAGTSVFYALDASAGTVVWSYQFQGGLTLPGFGAPVAANGLIYVGANSVGTIFAFDAATGTLVWKYAPAQYSMSRPVTANGIIYAGFEDNTLNSSHLVALDGVTGQVLWLDTSTNANVPIPVVAP